MRAALVTFSSLALTFMVIANAYYQKKQFYTSVIYVTKSSPSMAILYMQAFVLVYLLGKLMRKLFFGQLRPAEMEHLMERAWYAVTETCLAFTVFRDDFGTKFVAMFTILLFLKCFHWLAEDRVDYMERSPIIHTLFHIRAIGLLTVLCSLDMLFISHAYKSTITRGATVQLVFGFEYAILLLSIVSVGLRYILHVIDSRREAPWENKAVYLLYSDFVIAGIRVVIYLMFLIIMIRIHTLPLFAIRPIYLSMRFFKKAFHDVVMSRRAIRYMNTVFPTVTAADLEASDPVCIICREEMLAGTDGGAKKLPCGHLFHASCLRSWFQRQQTCPTCRMDILRAGGQQQQNARAAAAQPQQQQPQPAQQQQQQAQTPQSHQPAAQGSTQQQADAGQGSTSAAEQNQAGGASPISFPSIFPGFPGMPGMPSSSNPSTPAGFVPPMMPGMPPMMPGMPPLTAGFQSLLGSGMPDLSNVDLANLSDEQLVEMEGHGRRAVEARLETLRRIQTLLDAAVIQMHAYMMAVNAANPVGENETKSATQITANSTEKEVITSDVESKEKPSESIPDKLSNSAGDSSECKTEEHESIASVETSIETLTQPNVESSKGNASKEEEDENDPMAEIRRRRLERFDSQKDAAVE